MRKTGGRIAVLCGDGIEQRARILKELAYLADRHAHVDCFSVRRRGAPEMPDGLPGGVRFRTVQATLSKHGAQALLAGIPAWRAGGPPVVTLNQARALALGSAGLAGGLMAAGLPGAFWTAAAAGAAGAAAAALALWFWVWRRYGAVRGMTGLSPKTGAAVPVFVPCSSQYKNSHALQALVEAAIREEGPYDLVHAHDLVALEVGARLKRRHGGRLVWDAHEIYEDMAEEPDPGLAAVARRTIRGAAGEVDALITVTGGVADHYRDTHPDLPPGVVVMNAARRQAAVPDDGRLRAAIGAGPETRILLYQGGMTPNRGLPVLIDAAALLPEGWVLAMLGDGPLRPELEAQAARQTAALGQQRTWLLPAVAHSALARWTVGATLGIIPYQLAGKNALHAGPNKLWEFPAAGVPFIAPRLREIERIVAEYGTGFLFDTAFDAATIARAVAGTDDAALRAARENMPRFLDEMCWERFAGRIGSVYEELLGPGLNTGSAPRG